ncbi:hypothetical protein [Metapseudomonas furukawaii]|uniref:Uncharacterized protein n=1 Tax=Metapseudomonas furukawaii TaxID=1149133 RepID=A0AAD1FGS6_METFU|nr:hypothetical protein [Pseudomonas furukawaii]ELS25691.1 hypothetical protein ppKF707_0787 [Pseudomonas furukawaii]BAU76120.1 hypothetical protein KF707C_44320 [Pseudomonas furukawaii]
MAELKLYKVVASLPGALEPNAIYLVRVGNGYDQYVTNSSGTIVSYPMNLPTKGSLGLGAAADYGVTSGPTGQPDGLLWRTNDLVKTTSSTDTTAGRVTRVGDGGLLGDGPIQDPDTVGQPGGLYSINAASNLMPSWGPYLTLKYWGVDRKFQIGGVVSSAGAEGYYVRAQHANGVWSSRRALWHDGNFDPAGKQDANANLSAFADLTGSANKLPYFTGAGALALADFTVFGRSLVDDADAPAARATLGLGTAATRDATTSASDTTSERLWRTNDLVKVTGTTDSTSGRVLTTGYANLMSAAGTADFATVLGSRFLRASGDGPLGATICGGITIGVTGSIEQQLAARLGRLFFRSVGDPSGPTGWGEVYTTHNFDPATKASLSGATFTGTISAVQLNMSAQIVYEADNYGSGWARGLSYVDGGTTQAGIGGYGTAGVVEYVYMGYGASPWVAPYRVEVSSTKVSVYGVTVIESGQLQTKGSIESIRMYAPAGVNAIYQTFYDNQSSPVRLGYVGKGSTGNNNITLAADQGEVQLVRSGLTVLLSNATGATLNGYTKLGTDAPAIKQKKLTGTTAAAQGNAVTVAHGLTSSKILDVRVTIFYEAGKGIPTNHPVAGYQAGTGFDATNVTVSCIASNSANILSKPFTVLITYEE